MKPTAIIVMIFLIALIGAFPHPGAYLFMTVAGVMFGASCLTQHIWTKVHWLPALTFHYLILDSIIRSFLHFNGMDLGLLAGQSGLYILGIVSFALFGGATIGTAVVALAILDAIVLVGKASLGYSPYFLFANPAFDAGFIGCVIPPMLKTCDSKVKFLFLILAVLACFLTKSSTGVLAVAVAFASYPLSLGKFKPLMWLSITSPIMIASIIGYFMQGQVLFQGSGRYEVWKTCLNYFWDKANHWIGFGVGSYYALIPDQIIAKAASEGNLNPVVFPWALNDWVQTLFDTGYIGLTLAVALFFTALYRSRRSPSIFASLMTFGAVACTQKPCRFYLFSLFGAFLIIRAFTWNKPGPNSVLEILKTQANENAINSFLKSQWGKNNGQ